MCKKLAVVYEYSLDLLKPTSVLIDVRNAVFWVETSECFLVQKFGLALCPDRVHHIVGFPGHTRLLGQVMGQC